MVFSQQDIQRHAVPSTKNEGGIAANKEINRHRLLLNLKSMQYPFITAVTPRTAVTRTDMQFHPRRTKVSLLHKGSHHKRHGSSVVKTIQDMQFLGQMYTFIITLIQWYSASEIYKDMQFHPRRTTQKVLLLHKGSRNIRRGRLGCRRGRLGCKKIQAD